MITVSFACNDPDNGLWLGKCCAIQIGDNEFESPDYGFEGAGNRLTSDLKANKDDPSRCDRSFRISRRRFPCYGWKTWDGNWCWDATQMTGVDCLVLIRYLRELGWKMTAGCAALGDAYDSGAEITPAITQGALT